MGLSLSDCLVFNSDAINKRLKQLEYMPPFKPLAQEVINQHIENIDGDTWNVLYVLRKGEMIIYDVYKD